jgi:hypothetical protein
MYSKVLVVVQFLWVGSFIATIVTSYQYYASHDNLEKCSNELYCSQSWYPYLSGSTCYHEDLSLCFLFILLCLLGGNPNIPADTRRCSDYDTFEQKNKTNALIFWIVLVLFILTTLLCILLCNYVVHSHSEHSQSETQIEISDNQQHVEDVRLQVEETRKETRKPSETCENQHVEEVCLQVEET